ncbi:uncharacterized protein [Musca autumnalis]|uniref:uncharacterized protein n=1 Tax=Musca autumnalis TaxID=221902 RepID=UPI003CF85152
MDMARNEPRISRDKLEETLNQYFSKAGSKQQSISPVPPPPIINTFNGRSTAAFFQNSDPQTSKNNHVNNSSLSQALINGNNTSLSRYNPTPNQNQQSAFVPNKQTFNFAEEQDWHWYDNKKNISSETRDSLASYSRRVHPLAEDKIVLHECSTPKLSGSAVEKVSTDLIRKSRLTTSSSGDTLPYTRRNHMMSDGENAQYNSVSQFGPDEDKYPPAMLQKSHMDSTNSRGSLQNTLRLNSLTENGGLLHDYSGITQSAITEEKVTSQFRRKTRWDCSISLPHGNDYRTAPQHQATYTKDIDERINNVGGSFISPAFGSGGNIFDLKSETPKYIAQSTNPSKQFEKYPTLRAIADKISNDQVISLSSDDEQDDMEITGGETSLPDKDVSVPPSKSKEEREKKFYRNAIRYLRRYIDNDPNKLTEKEISFIRSRLKYKRKFEREFPLAPKSDLPIDRIHLPTKPADSCSPSGEASKVKKAAKSPKETSAVTNALKQTERCAVQTNDAAKAPRAPPQAKSTKNNSMENVSRVAPHKTETICKFTETTTTKQTIEVRTRNTSPKRDRTTKPENRISQHKSSSDYRVAIIDKANNEGKISDSHWLLVEAGLRQLIVSDTGNPEGKQFGGAVIYKGAKVIYCRNKESVDFLVQAVHSLRNLWQGSQLSAVSVGEIPCKTPLRAWVPPPPIATDRILNILEKQNLNLRTSNWKIIHSHACPERGGLIIKVVTDQEGDDYLRKRDGKLNFGLGSIQFHLPTPPPSSRRR